MGAFTFWLIQNGSEAPTSWHNYPTYHIEVNTSEDEFLSSFCMDHYQVKKVGFEHPAFFVTFVVAFCPILR